MSFRAFIQDRLWTYWNRYRSRAKLKFHSDAINATTVTVHNEQTDDRNNLSNVQYCNFLIKTKENLCTRITVIVHNTGRKTGRRRRAKYFNKTIRHPYQTPARRISFYYIIFFFFNTNIIVFLIIPGYSFLTYDRCGDCTGILYRIDGIFNINTLHRLDCLSIFQQLLLVINFFSNTIDCRQSYTFRSFINRVYRLKNRFFFFFCIRSSA